MKRITKLIEKFLNQGLFVPDFEMIAHESLRDTFWKRLKNKHRCYKMYWLYLD